MLNETFLISTILILFSQKMILMKVNFFLTGMGQTFLCIVYSSFSLNTYYWWHHDSSKIDHLLQENFNKESKCYSQHSDNENHKSVSNPCKTIALNDSNFENDEPFLIDQNTMSTFWCSAKFFFHHKWNEVQLLVLNVVYTSCLTSCWTT